MRAYVPLAIGTIAAVVVIQHQSETELRAAKIESCERGNVIRLSNWREANEEANREYNLYWRIKAYDEPIARIHHDAYERARARARNYVASANNTGYQTGAGLPTIICTEAYPEPDWWPF